MHLSFFRPSGDCPLFPSPPLPSRRCPPFHGRIARSGRLAEPQPHMSAWIGDKAAINGEGNTNEI